MIIRKISRLFLKYPKIYEPLRNVYLKTIYTGIVKPYRDKIWAEQRVSWGNENPQKTFYIIRRKDENCGIFSWVMVIIGHLSRAEKNGWIPVIDMKSYPNTFIEEYEINKVNAWELFFKQPAGYTMEDINKSKNIILSSMFPVENSPDNRIYFDKEKREEWAKLRKKYIFLNEEMQSDIDRMADGVIGEGNVLGVLCRGTDYWSLKPSDHPVQPNIEQIVQQIDIALKQTNADKIYLCTEDITILNSLTEQYKDKIVTYSRDYVEYTGGYVASSNTKNKVSKRQLTYDYLMQVLLLSRSDHIVAGRVGGTCGALLFSNGYRYEYFWDLGNYS